MTTVSLAGRLGEIVGVNFCFKTRNLREVLAAIESNTGKLRSYLGNNGKRRFAIFVNEREIDPTAGENIDVRNKKVLIIPLLMGGFVAMTAAITSAIVGASAVAAGTIMAKVVSFVVGTVLGAALAFGLNLLISKLMKPDDPDRANTTSFLFGQAENVARQGVVVPVGYGRMIIGSRTVSVNLFQVDRSLYDKARGGGGMGSIASIVKDSASSISPTNDGIIKMSNRGASDPIDYTINSDGSSSAPIIP